MKRRPFTWGHSRGPPVLSQTSNQPGRSWGALPASRKRPSLPEPSPSPIGSGASVSRAPAVSQALRPPATAEGTPAPQEGRKQCLYSPDQEQRQGSPCFSGPLGCDTKAETTERSGGLEEGQVPLRFCEAGGDWRRRHWTGTVSARGEGGLPRS